MTTCLLLPLGHVDANAHLIGSTLPIGQKLPAGHLKDIFPGRGQ